MNSGYEWKVINAAGSAQLRIDPSVLHTITIEASTGTIQLFDSASGTSSNKVITVGGGAATPATFTLDAQLKRGCYYLATGTPSAVLTFG